jgi:hypothetical protein
LLKFLKYGEVNGDRDKAGNEVQDEDKAEGGGLRQPVGLGEHFNAQYVVHVSQIVALVSRLHSGRSKLLLFEGA